MKQNADDFIYTKCLTCNLSYGTEILYEYQGFLTDYSKYSLSEDQAEVFSFWMTDISILNSISKNDVILKNKINTN